MNNSINKLENKLLELFENELNLNENNDTKTKEFLEKIRSSSYLSKRGYVIKKDVFNIEQLSELKHKLRGRPIQDEKYAIYNKDSSFPLFMETKNKIYIPKMYGIKTYGLPDKILDNYNGDSWKKEHVFNGTLMEHQIEPVKLLVKELQEGSGGGILSLVTGGGKTFCCIKTLSELKTKTIIIVNKISLLKQWEYEIKQFLPTVNIGIIQGKKNVDIKDKDIVVAMLQSLARVEYDSNLFNLFGVVVFDEVHNVSSKVFSKVLTKLCCKYTIGLSATPNRSDGCEYVFKWFLGEIVYQSKTERKGIAPILNVVKLNSDEYIERSIVNKITNKKQIQFTSMLGDLIKMPKRNKMIIELIKHYISTEDRRILVLSDRREHVKNLKEILDSDKDVSFSYGLFLGQMKIKDLEKSKSSQVILATYQAFGEGVNEKSLDTLILTTPKKFVGHLKNSSKAESGKLEQIIGRIFRKEHTTKHPLIVDLHDNFSIYKNQSTQRMAFYKQHFPNLFIRDQTIDLDNFTVDELKIELLKHKRFAKTNKSIGTSIVTEKEDDTKLIKSYCFID